MKAMKETTEVIELHPMQAEVYELLRQGLTPNEMAERLDLAQPVPSKNGEGGESMEERYGVIEGTSYCYIVDRWAQGLKVIEKVDSKTLADKRVWELNYGWGAKKKEEEEEIKFYD